MDILEYDNLDDKIKLKFYKHIEDKFVKKYEEMGLTPFKELSKTSQENDIKDEINRKYVLLKTEGIVFLLRKEIKSFIY